MYIFVELMLDIIGKFSILNYDYVCGFLLKRVKSLLLRKSTSPLCRKKINVVGCSRAVVVQDRRAVSCTRRSKLQVYQDFAFTI